MQVSFRSFVRVGDKGPLMRPLIEGRLEEEAQPLV